MATLRSAPHGRRPRCGHLPRFEQAEGYIASICFKTGPPATVGVELEYTVHAARPSDRPAGSPTGSVRRSATTPRRPCDAGSPHAPAAARRRPSPSSPAARSDLAARPQRSLAGAPRRPSAPSSRSSPACSPAAAWASAAPASTRTARRGGCCPPPATTRWQRAFARRSSARPHHDVQHRRPAGLPRRGPAGGSPTAGPPCTTLGPPLLALFANSRRHAGHDTGWASARHAHLAGDGPVAGPGRCRPATTRPPTGPGMRWTRQLLCVRRGRRHRGPRRPASRSPTGSAARWTEPPTYARPRLPPEHAVPAGTPARLPGGAVPRHASPGRDWFAPVGAAHRAARRPSHHRRGSRELCAPAAGRWVERGPPRHWPTRPSPGPRPRCVTWPATGSTSTGRLELPAALLEGRHRREHPQ